MKYAHHWNHLLLQVTDDGFIRLWTQIDQHARHERIVHMFLVADAHALFRHADAITGDELS